MVLKLRIVVVFVLARGSTYLKPYGIRGRHLTVIRIRTTIACRVASSLLCESTVASRALGRLYHPTYTHSASLVSIGCKADEASVTVLLRECIRLAVSSLDRRF